MKEKRLPLPPFTMETAKQKIQLAEDAWNSKDPVRVSQAIPSIANGAIVVRSLMAVNRL